MLRPDKICVFVIYQVFETGQVLLTANEPRNNEKFEVHVDSDDLSGDRTTWISLFTNSRMASSSARAHMPRLLSRFTVGLKRQDNIWRLNDMSINIKVPLGDPKLLEKTLAQGSPGMMGGLSGFGGFRHAAKRKDLRDLPPKDAIMMVAFVRINLCQPAS